MDTRLKHFLTGLIIVLVAIGAVWFGVSRSDRHEPGDVTPAPSPKHTPTLEPHTSEKLPVPYVNETPSGNWSGPWKNACEEASIAMAEVYYRGRTSVSIAEAEAFMIMLFEKQNAKYGNNVNSDATQFKYLIDNFTSFGAEIVRNPTIEQIKEELDDERPVISLHYGFDLHNPNIPFLPNGTYYHAMVIIGHDDAAQEFIVNDDGDPETGAGHRYGYDLFMSSLNEYSYATKKVDGVPTVLFTNSL